MIINLFLNKLSMWRASAVTRSQEQRSSMLLPQTEIQEYMALSHTNWSQENFLLFSQWIHPQVLYESIIQKGYNYTTCIFSLTMIFFFVWSHVIPLKLRFCWAIILERMEDLGLIWSLCVHWNKQENGKHGKCQYNTGQAVCHLTLFSAINLFIIVRNNQNIIFYNNIRVP